jgi:hypothetical protein
MNIGWSWTPRILKRLSLSNAHMPIRRNKRLSARLGIEMFEDRCLPSAGAFLQGFAFVDSNGNNRYDTGEGLANATIKLFAADTATLANYPGSTLSTVLASATTPGSGYYLFTDASILVSNTSGLAAGNYLIVETPPATYSNVGTDIQSQLNPATQVNASTIRVTLENPKNLIDHFDSYGAGANDTPILSGTPEFGFTGQLNIHLTGTSPTFTTPEFTSLCLGLTQNVIVNSFFGVVPSPTMTNAGQIAYLYDHYGTTTLDNVHGEALQEAVWKLEYGSAFTPDLSHTGVAAAYNFYLTDAAGKFEAAAFLNYPRPSKGTPNGQNMIATDMLNFFDGPSSASPTIVTSPGPTIVIGSGARLIDTATLSNGYRPTGTITFTLYGPNNAVVDTETVAVNGNGAYSTPTGYLPTAIGTYQWVASYSGDSINSPASGQRGDEPETVIPASPTLVTTPSAASITLVATVPVLTDSADLEGGYQPTGMITFTLTYNSNVVDMESVAVNGNGVYSTPAGYALPTSGTVTGTYQWSAHYSGDINNNGADDQGGASEQTVVNPANPVLVTTASPSITLGTTAPTISDSAVLSGGYFPTGSIAFTLKLGSTVVYTTSDPVSGNGTYSASFTLPTTGTVTGTYTWSAHYSGDTNNNAADDQGGAAEQTVVSPADPTLVTTASPAITLGTSAPTITDSAVLSGGYYPTGSITFTLQLGSTTVATVTDPVNGDGPYSASYTLPTTGTVTGTYTWSAHYSGDGNNTAADDQGGAAEQTVVNPNNPILVTTASPAITLGSTAPTITDSAILSGAYFPTGSIAFTLQLGSTMVATVTDPVSGNGTYSASYTLPTTGTVTGTYTWSAHYSGDSNNNPADDQGGAAEQTVVNPANPALVTTASPAITLGTTAPTISDSAVLSGGYYPTGSISFTLKLGSTTVFATSDPVSGNGTYSASYTLPTTGTVAGTYTWSAHYSGDGNNNPADDQGGAAEQTVVNPANPALVTTASPAITLGTTAPTISDSAVLSGGYYPTGSISFTLKLGSTTVFTTSDPVSGNGTYSASFTLPTTGTVAGTYTWSAHYSGDGNNNPADDQGGAAEQTVVNPANPALVTTASPAITLGTTAPTITDSAVLSGGYFPTGNIVFTLKLGSTTVATVTDTVSGNGTYSASYTLPTSGTVTGTYTWSAHYSGDSNNNAANDQGGASEQTVVNPANPTLVTAASSAVTLGNGTTTITDSAVLSGGYFPTGTIVFTLKLGSTTVATVTDTVNGNNTYTASYTLPTSGTVTGTYTWSAHYSGDSNNNSANDQGGASEQTLVSPANPTLVTTASSAITLGTTAPTISDSAVLSGGYHPTGTITFTLKLGSTTVATVTDTVNGNGTYTASFTLPTTGTAAGTYTWSAHYSGDSNNNSANDQGGASEQTVVNPANPMLVTTASSAITLGTTAPTITDSAVLSGGYFPTGSIVFTLKLGSTTVATVTDTVNGNGTYSASFTLSTSGTAAGTYTWSAHYSGDSNNSAANDQGGASEQTVVSPANPTLTTTPGGTIILGSGNKLTDSATLMGGYFPTGTITFTLNNPSNTPVYTDVVTVSGNGTYTTAQGNNPGGFLPTVAGTYQWVVTYSGDTNNNSANSPSGSEPETVVSPPQINITKAADQSMINAGQTAGYVVTISNTGGTTATSVSLSDPLPPGPASDINWMIDTSGMGLGAGTNPADFQISGSVGSQNLGLSSSFISGGDSLAPGQSISVHITGVTSTNDTTSSTNPALGLAGNYAVLYTGTGGHNLGMNNITLTGNIGIAGTGQAQFSGPLTLNGRVDFSAANTGQYHTSGNLTGPTSVNYSVSAVTSAINTVNSLSSSLAGLGSNLVINGTQTINESAGQLNTVNGVTYRVFNVTSYSENNGNVVTINGDGSGNPVVFNFGFASNVNLGGDVSLTGGLSDDLVLWNFTTSGKAVSLNNNASSFPPPAAFHGVIMAPNDTLSMDNSSFAGRIFGGDSSDMQIISGDVITAPSSSAKLVNTATVSATGVTPVSASATIMVNPVAPPLLTISKTADASTVTAGSTMGFLVTITNIGSTTALGLSLSDALPAGTGGDMTWTVDTSGTGRGAGTIPADFTVTGSLGHQNLVLSSSFVSGGDSLAAGASISVHITSPTNAGDANGGNTAATGFDTTGTVAANTITLGTANNYAALGLQNTVMTNSKGKLHGNEGVSQGGSLTNNGNFTIQGNVFEFSTGQFTNGGTLTGTVTTNPTLLTQNDTDALNCASTAKGLTATQTFAGISLSNQTQTINGNGGLNVIQINGDITMSGTSKILLNGTASDVFVVNVTGTLNLSGVWLLGLSGNTTANHVLYNFTGASGTLSTGLQGSSFGTFLAPHYSWTVDGNFVGEIILGGSSFIINSGSKINAGGVISNTATVTGSNVSSASSSANISIQPTSLGNFVNQPATTTTILASTRVGNTILPEKLPVDTTTIGIVSPPIYGAKTVSTLAENGHTPAKKTIVDAVFSLDQDVLYSAPFAPGW